MIAVLLADEPDVDCVLVVEPAPVTSAIAESINLPKPNKKLHNTAVIIKIPFIKLPQVLIFYECTNTSNDAVPV